MDQVAADAKLDIDLGGGKRRDGSAWLRGLEAGKPSEVDRNTCHRLENALGLARDKLWRLLLLDERKLDPEIRAYYEEEITRIAGAPADESSAESRILTELRHTLAFGAGEAPRPAEFLTRGLSRMLATARSRIDLVDAPTQLRKAIVARGERGLKVWHASQVSMVEVLGDLLDAFDRMPSDQERREFLSAVAELAERYAGAATRPRRAAGDREPAQAAQPPPPTAPDPGPWGAYVVDDEVVVLANGKAAQTPIGSLNGLPPATRAALRDLGIRFVGDVYSFSNIHALNDEDTKNLEAALARAGLPALTR